MQNGRIKGRQIAASSSWDGNHGPSNARLHWRRRGPRIGAWCARHNTRYQWLQVDFIHAARVVKIATQGRQDAAQWVTQYYLTYSQDGAHFAEFKKNSNRKVSVSLLCALKQMRSYRKNVDCLPVLVKEVCSAYIYVQLMVIKHVYLTIFFCTLSNWIGVLKNKISVQQILSAVIIVIVA